MKSSFSLRAFISVLVSTGFAVIVLSGGILFVSPPGRVANWTNWQILGLTKHEWTAVHILFSSLFLLASLLHIWLNWRPLLGYFKDRVTRRISLRWEWAVALLLCGGVYAGTRAHVPPIGWLLDWNEDLKQSWDKPQDRAPIPHAELLTLAELCEKAKVDVATAQRRLEAKNIRNATPETVVEQIATQNQVAAQEIFRIITAESPARGAGGHGGGAGGGPGWMTLPQFCESEGLKIDDALARLKAAGYKAATNQTMREIAVDNGLQRPFELVELLRKK